MTRNRPERSGATVGHQHPHGVLRLPAQPDVTWHQKHVAENTDESRVHDLSDVQCAMLVNRAGTLPSRMIASIDGNVLRAASGTGNQSRPSVLFLNQSNG